MPSLVWNRSGRKRVFRLGRTVMVVGRDPVSDIVLDDATVSRRHALVQVAGGAVKLTDLGSNSGTKINGAGLTPQLPSTLAAGDLVQLGRVQLVFETAAAAPAPPKKAAAPPPAPPPVVPPPPAAAAPPSDVWKYVALGLAFVLVGTLGALIALAVADDGPAPAPDRAAAPPEPEPAREPEPAEPAPPPVPAVPPEPARAVATVKKAPRGALPPAGHAPLRDYPDLLELDAAEHHAFKLEDWGDLAVTGIGADGRRYRVARNRVTRIDDRADLVRRAERARLALPPDDVERRLELAAWCARRLVHDEARRLVAEVLAVRPQDPVARALDKTLAGSG